MANETVSTVQGIGTIRVKTSEGTYVSIEDV